MGCDDRSWKRKPVPPLGRSHEALMKKSHLSSLRSEPHAEPQEEVGLMTDTGFLRQGNLSSLPQCSLLPVPLGLGLELPGSDEGVHLRDPGNWPSTVPQRESLVTKLAQCFRPPIHSSAATLNGQAESPLSSLVPPLRDAISSPWSHGTQNHISNRGRAGPWCSQDTVDSKTDQILKEVGNDFSKN